MKQRRILLVDADQEFQRFLTKALAPYGFEIVRDDSADALTRIAQLAVAAVIIAVDDPDKRGYALFNKAKKGAAANVPVVLATSTILPEVFSGHRKLKVHADEYLDKRTLSRPELIGKLDNLLGLGEIIASSPDMALLVDDDYLVDDDVLVDEVDSAELDLGAIDDLIVDERMVSDNDLLLGDLDAEADAAFAMLTDGVEDSGSQPALEPEPEPEVVPVAPPAPVAVAVAFKSPATPSGGVPAVGPARGPERSRPLRRPPC